MLRALGISGRLLKLKLKLLLLLKGRGLLLQLSLQFFLSLILQEDLFELLLQECTIAARRVAVGLCEE